MKYNMFITNTGNNKMESYSKCPICGGPTFVIYRQTTRTIQCKNHEHYCDWFIIQETKFGFKEASKSCKEIGNETCIIDENDYWETFSKAMRSKGMNYFHGMCSIEDIEK